ncbi:MAG: tetratricopeptide repeat protein [Candidatus Latescibacteria bacterium]|nr:tetratricopeptide repeat protein [Candidatus Latescibacterota bacterium]
MPKIASTATLLALALIACTADPPPPSPPPAPAPSPVAAHLEKARAFYQSARFTEAAASARAGLALDSTAAELHNMLASTYTAQGRYALAIEAIEKALRQQPDYPLALVNLGGIYTKLGQYGQAEQYLLRAAELAPGQSSVHRRLGELYLGTSRYDEAADQLEQALQVYPDDATLFFFLGQAREGAGQFQQGLEAFARAGRLDIGFAEAHYRTAALARRLGQGDRATGALERFQHLQNIGGGDPDIPKQLKKLRASILNAPEEAGHHYRLGLFFIEHNYADQALDKFAKVAHLLPTDAHLLNQIGSILFHHDRIDDAIVFYRQAIDARPTYLAALVNTAIALGQQQRHDEALGYYRRAVETAPGDAKALYHLSLGLSLAGDRAEAKQVALQARPLSQANPLLLGQIEDLLQALEGEPRQ